MALKVVIVKGHTCLLIYPWCLCSAGSSTIRTLVSLCSYFILSHRQSALNCLCNYTLFKCSAAF